MVPTREFRATSFFLKSMGHLRICIWLVSLVLLFSSISLAQRDLGTITGTVTDSTGAVVPGATITITNNGTGESSTLKTTAAGDFTRPALLPGTYTVTAEAQGFRRASREKVEVTAGSRVGVPFTMEIGQLSESVVVTGQAPLVQDESVQLGAQLSTDAVTALPLGAQRTFTYLARLSPGVVPGESGRDSGTGGFSANGVRDMGENNFLLNGVDNNVNVIDFLNGAAFVVGPPPEAIGEMTVMTSGANAEYGRAAGGVINVNLKTGTNQLHGGLWEVLQNNDLNANSWINNRVGAPRPVYRQNQFGAAAGGPIIRNRFFVFGDYQGTRYATTSSGYNTIPTPAEIQGNFSALLGSTIATTPSGSVAQYEIFDPASTQTVNGQLTRTPFPGNIIPQSEIGPIQTKILSLFPAPNQPVHGFPINDYYSAAANTQQVDSGDLRSDFRLSDKDSFYGSLSWSDNAKGSTSHFNPVLGDSAGGGDTQTTPTRNAQLGYTRVWTPTIVTETRVAVTRLDTQIFGPGQTVDDDKIYGLGGYDPFGTMPEDGGLYQMNPARYTSMGASTWEPMNMHSNVQDYIQNLAIMKGSHAFKFGGEYRFIQFPFVQVSDPHGQMNFSQNATAYPSTANGSTGAINTNTGDGLASYLLGIVDTGEISSTTAISSQKQTYSFYAQDDWKVTPKLTLNLGIRYELFSPTYERFGRQSNFVYNPAAPTLEIPTGPNQGTPLPPNFATAFPNVIVTRGQVSKYIVPWDKKDFGPRFGLAYKLAANTVVRLGFGIYYGGEENQGGSPNLGESVPFNETIELARTDLNLNPIGLFAANPFFPNGFSGGIPSNVFSLPAPISFKGIALDWRNPLVSKWNVALQHQLPWGVALEVAYVGNDQIHQTSNPTANACSNMGTTNPNITCQSLQPIPYIGEGSIIDTNGWGNYNALTVKVEKRLSNGVEFISSYAWSHALTDVCPGLNGCAVFDPNNFMANYANAQWDLRQTFVTGFTYQLPVGMGRQFGSHMNPVLNQIVGGWGLNGILTLRGGIPLSLGYNGCQGVWNSCRPDIAPGQNANAAPPGGRSPAKWFNTAAVTVPAPLTGGDAGPYNIRAPGASTLDAALFKTFRFTERFSMEFRLEAFNAFNKVQFGSPDTNLQDSTFGQITSSSGERNAQLSLRLHF
jgi:outer membrane receptor protein involved in Fe transport